MDVGRYVFVKGLLQVELMATCNFLYYFFMFSWQLSRAVILVTCCETLIQAYSHEIFFLSSDHIQDSWLAGKGILLETSASPNGSFIATTACGSRLTLCWKAANQSATLNALPTACAQKSIIVCAQNLTAEKLAIFLYLMDFIPQ